MLPKWLFPLFLITIFQCANAQTGTTTTSCLPFTTNTATFEGATNQPNPYDFAAAGALFQDFQINPAHKYNMTAHSGRKVVFTTPDFFNPRISNAYTNGGGSPLGFTLKSFWFACGEQHLGWNRPSNCSLLVTANADTYYGYGTVSYGPFKFVYDESKGPMGRLRKVTLKLEYELAAQYKFEVVEGPGQAYLVVDDVVVVVSQNQHRC